MRKIIFVTLFLVFSTCFINAQSSVTLNKIYSDVPLNTTTIESINNDNQVIVQIIPSSDPSVPPEKKCTIITRLRDDMPTHLASFDYIQDSSIETLRQTVMNRLNSQGWIPFGGPFYGNGVYVQLLYKPY